MSERTAWPRVLDTHPPGRCFGATELARVVGNKWYVATPTLNLFCSDEPCSRTMKFSGEVVSDEPLHNDWQGFFLEYECNNCRTTTKTFAILARIEPELGQSTEAIKVGEWPPFGAEPIPTRLITLAGVDKEMLLQGRRSERLGFGIGAFAYYRRVVENRKVALLDKIIEVANKLGQADAVAALEKAKAETQFSKSIQDIRQAVPESLKIDGHNPLTLLHKALSHNLHTESDQVCLAAAQDIRVVLTELMRRIADMLTENADLKKSLARLTPDKGSKNTAP